MSRLGSPKPIAFTITQTQQQHRSVSDRRGAVNENVTVRYRIETYFFNSVATPIDDTRRLTRLTGARPNRTVETIVTILLRLTCRVTETYAGEKYVYRTYIFLIRSRSRLTH